MAFEAVVMAALFSAIILIPHFTPYIIWTVAIVLGLFTAQASYRRHRGILDEEEAIYDLVDRYSQKYLAARSATESPAIERVGTGLITRHMRRNHISAKASEIKGNIKRTVDDLKQVYVDSEVKAEIAALEGVLRTSHVTFRRLKLRHAIRRWRHYTRKAEKRLERLQYDPSEVERAYSIEP